MMGLPDYVVYADEKAYREHFERCYVKVAGGMKTFDGIVVQFFPEMFDHAFFESSDRRNPTKDVFCTERAKRIDWIRFALESDAAEIFETLHESGTKRRLTLVAGNYLVVIQLDERVTKRARFITAYIHDHPDRVRRGPRNKRIWPKKE
ncbi:MAG TPA: hypothetical protein VNH11_15205 [Pirellulales bacterium]|nr:hypothetical protein [Pirellulales bacterium]